MKNLIVLCTLVTLVLAACQEAPVPVDIEAETKAIMEVIQVESEYARDGEYEKFTNLYVHDDINTRVISRPDTMWVIKGWDNIIEDLSYIWEREKIEDHPVSVYKKNPIVRVSGNCAWVVCDNIWKGTWEGEEVYTESLQITFLEKIGEEWKITFSNWTSKPVTSKDDQEE